MNDISEDGVYSLVEAIAENAANEYREYMKLYKTSHGSEKQWYKHEADIALEFFDSELFKSAFPNSGQYIIEQLKKEVL